MEDQPEIPEQVKDVPTLDELKEAIAKAQQQNVQACWGEIETTLKKYNVRLSCSVKITDGRVAENNIILINN